MLTASIEYIGIIIKNNTPKYAFLEPKIFLKAKFKDHFSDKSAAYRVYRPVYPDTLFSYLASITPDHDRAWDCGTGSGQSAISLSDYYREVIATDASENQINNARQKHGVIYKNETAEKTMITHKTE